MRRILYIPSPHDSIAVAEFATGPRVREIEFIEHRIDAGPEDPMIRSTAGTLDEVLPTADALLTQGEGLNADQLGLAERCLIVAHAGPGSGGTDLEAARRTGIPVISVPDCATKEYTDLTIELIQEFGGDRTRRRLGIVGLGSVGRAVADRARRLRWEVWAFDPFAHHESFRQTEAKKAPLPDLLGTSDVVTLHLPLGPETRAFLGEEAFDLMKPGARLINTSDPALVDTGAMVQALAASRIATAAMGVLPDEMLKSMKQDDRELLDELCRRKKLRLLDLEPLLSSRAVRARALRAALRVILDYFDGIDPVHLLIDPPLPRLRA